MKIIVVVLTDEGRVSVVRVGQVGGWCCGVGLGASSRGRSETLLGARNWLGLSVTEEFWFQRRTQQRTRLRRFLKLVSMEKKE